MKKLIKYITEKLYHQQVDEKLVFNKHTKAKSSNVLDDLQKYDISIMSEDDINKFSYFHTVKYNINKSYLSKLRKWHGSITDNYKAYKANEQKFHNAINYLQTIDNNISTITLSNSIGGVEVIKIKFNTSKYDIIQIKLPPSTLKRFCIELYNENKIEEYKKIALEAIKYILENP